MITKFGPLELRTDRPPVVIAEVGVNHNGSLDLGLRQLRAAAATGAQAVKFQSFRADELAASWTPTADYQRNASSGTQRQMLRQLELDGRDLHVLLDEGRRLGVVAFSTPFDARSAAELAEMGAEVMKIASGEITNVDLIMAVAETRLPTIISTGMSNLEEVARAVDLHRSRGGGPLALLHCVSSYPTRLEDMNLRAINTLRETFDLPVGLSDHSVGTEAAILAVAMGAMIIEKHFTIDRLLPGPDQSMSTEPEMFTQLVRLVASAHAALGSGKKAPVASEVENRRLSRRGLVASAPIRAGTILTREMIAAKRPASGIEPRHVDSVVGRRLRRDLAEDESIGWSDLE